MNTFIKALILGTAAGIIDVIPMLFLDLSWQANISAFLHWLALGLIITYARFPMRSWLSGLLTGLLTGIPIAVLTTATDTAAVIPILCSSIILGSLLGLAAEKLITNQRTR